MKQLVALAVVGLAAAAAVAGEEVTLPEALKGFKGMMIGTIAAKGEREFVLEVEKITRTWKANKAENPQAAVGKKVACELWPKGRLFERQLRTLRELKVGDRVLVEPFHLEPGHDHLTVVEELRKLAEEGPKEEPGALPEGFRGFRGMVAGTLVKKGEAAFLLKVEKITRVWKGSKAKNPESIVGKEVEVRLWKKSRLYEQHLRTLRELEPGDRIVCEPFHFEGDDLTLVEELRKAE